MSRWEWSGLVKEAIEKIGKDHFLDSYEEFIGEILQGGKLNKKEKILILAGIYVSKGWVGYINDFLMEQMKQLNIKAEEIVEVLETVALSRGPISLFEGTQVFSLFLKGEDVERARGGKTSKSSQEILDYFKSRFKEVPTWIEAMGQKFPDALQQYYRMRSGVIEEGVLPRRIKELVLVGVNAAGLFHEGMKGHMNGALQSGSSNGEILETLLVSILGGGIVAWIDGISVMKEMGIL